MSEKSETATAATATRASETPAKGPLEGPPKRRFARPSILLGGLAAAATGTVVIGGVVVGTGMAGGASAGDKADETTVSAAVAQPKAGVSRTPELSRSNDRREATDPTKAASLAAAAAGDVEAVTQSVNAADGDPKAIASALLGDYGWSSSQFGCLVKLWDRESHWNPLAHNRSSGAHGIPQALPGSKMASAGPNWQTNPVTQIKWGLGYIRSRYGSPCSAWGHSESHGWY